jgi:hypothetical protein
MKNVYYTLLLLLFGLKGFSQGSDVIFLIDNSASITATEFAQVQNSINNLFTSVLTCNPDNRVAVVQYSQDGTGARIFINSDFTATSFLFNRAYPNGPGGNVYGSVDLVANALNAIPSAGITSTITTLNRTPGNGLVVYLFSDAPRNNDLVNGVTINTNPPFASFTNFKNNFGATFIVTLVVAAGDITAAPAAAGIASAGGGYAGPVESYTNDPDFSQTPRFLLIPSSGGFTMTTQEIDIVTDDICSVSVPACVSTLTLSSPTDDVTGQDNRRVINTITASNHFSNGAVGIYHSENTIVLAPGFHSVIGSRFRGYIDECNSGFAGRPAAPTEDGIEEVSTIEPSDETTSISPNPATNRVLISTGRTIVNITIVSFDGKLMMDRDISGTSTYEFDVSNFTPGYYAVTITTDTGERITKKLIKN